VPFTEYYLDDQSKKVEKCKSVVRYKVLVNLKGRGHLGDAGLEGRIILKSILKVYVRKRKRMKCCAVESIIRVL
jgi:hypothetical protein